MANRKDPPVDPPANARLGCGCVVSFREGVQGSPVTVVIARKAPGCETTMHVAGLPVFDHREALRPATRFLPAPQPDFEEG
jgi:hypothetical protein